MKKLLLSVFAVSTMLSGVAADGMPEKKSRSSDAGWRFEVGALGGGSAVQNRVKVRDLDYATPDYEAAQGGFGGHGGAFATAGYVFDNGITVALQAEGGAANDVTKGRKPVISGGAWARAYKVRRTATYAGSLLLGKSYGKVFPYVKMGWRHNHFKRRIIVVSAPGLTTSGKEDRHSYSEGGLMVGLGAHFDFTKNVFFGADLDYSVAKENKTSTGSGVGIDAAVRVRSSIAQFSFKLGYRF